MNYSDWEDLFALSAPELWPRLGEASALRERHFGRRVSFCVIINAKSGMCSEDCAFCSQSAKASSQAPHYPLLPKEELVAAAQQAAAAGASRFSLVTAGRGIMSPKDQSAMLAAVAAIKEAVPIRICASLGIVDRGFLAELKAGGLYRFHHNLETAASFFPRICTTHTFAQRVATIEHAQAVGLSVCAWAISQRWGKVSPNPKIPPAHTDNPTSWAASMVATRSAKVWVVQIRGKKEAAVSRLW